MLIRKLLKSFNYSLLTYSSAFAVLVTMQGCFNVKPSTPSAASHLYETYYAGDQGIQYFIKPMSFENVHREFFVLDITFRYKKVLKDSATINFSVLSRNHVPGIDSIRINNTVLIKEIGYLYAENYRSGFLHRGTFKMPQADVSKLFDNNRWNIVVYQKNGVGNYRTTRKTAKKILKLKKNIFAFL